jgi:hypothetical protein
MKFVQLSTRHFLLPSIAVLLGIYACNSENTTKATGADTALRDSNDSILSYVESSSVLPDRSGVGYPFDSIDFDRVLAYEFDGREELNSRIISEEGNFVKTIKKQKHLTAGQVTMITRCLSDTATYGEGTRACFAPSEAIVFFKGKKPVMSIDICLDCNYLESSVPIPARSVRQIKVDDRVFPAIGFSVQGRQCIIDLSKELNFVYGSFDPRIDR